jgi:F-type H+-transporting ATPase subunit delta
MARESSVARIYAETLLQLARDRNAVERTAAEVAALRQALQQAPDLRLFLETPRISEHEKKAVLRRTLSGMLSEETLRFVEVVLERGRQHLLPVILEGFEALAEEFGNRQTMEVTSAVPLPGPVRERLRDIFARLTGRVIVLQERLDPSLLGGVVVQLGDIRIDGSIRSRLDQLRERMLRATPAAAGAQ